MMKRSEPLCKIIQYFSCLDSRIVANNALQATDTVPSCLVSLMQNMHKRKYKRKCINKCTCTTTYILMKDPMHCKYDYFESLEERNALEL